MNLRKAVIIFFCICNGMILHSQIVDSLWQKGIACFQLQNYHGTIAYMDSLLSLSPELSDAYYNRGVAWINLGNSDRACSDFRKSQELGSEINKDFVDYECNPEFVREFMLKQFYKDEKVYPELGYRPRYTRADTLRGALRKERTCYDVIFYDLYVKILPKSRKIVASNQIFFSVVQPTKSIQVDLFDRYKIKEISWNGNSLLWRREYNALFIEFPKVLAEGELHSVFISYEGKPIDAPNPPWDGGFVWKHDNDKNLWLGVSCEHLGASSWWPNKDHLSDKPDSMQISLEIPAGYQAISNGDLRKKEQISKKYNRFTWFIEYPINNYNATFYVGKYVSFSDTLIQGNDTLRLDYNVLEHNLDIAKKHFKQSKEVLSYYNKAFGFYPYPKDGFGLVESPYEGMEHQTAIAYGHGYTQNKTQDYENGMYDYIIVHEAAHEWWGNSVTAADMADVWIHEGFATYAELIFLEDRLGKDAYYTELVENSRYIFNIWPMVQNRDVNEDAFASNDVYNKGAMTLHCLRSTINNDTLFFRIIKDFCIQNKYKAVSSADFISLVNRYTGTDFSAFFKIYLEQTSLPVLEYSFKNDSSNLILEYRWNGVDEGFEMPFGIETSKGNSLRLLANTGWQKAIVPDATWFSFYNLWKGYKGCADNSFTYYNTLKTE